MSRNAFNNILLPWSGSEALDNSDTGRFRHYQYSLKSKSKAKKPYLSIIYLLLALFARSVFQ
ncbi:MAG: hypothetical protein HGA93_00065 [Methanothrix sp.]|nr:hypothetical protein [Methanothrix sp.]